MKKKSIVAVIVIAVVAVVAVVATVLARDTRSRSSSSSSSSSASAADDVDDNDTLPINNDGTSISSIQPTSSTAAPSASLPTVRPSTIATIAATTTLIQSSIPTSSPSTKKTELPTNLPTTIEPTDLPTSIPTALPTANPTLSPTVATATLPPIPEPAEDADNSSSSLSLSGSFDGMKGAIVTNDCIYNDGDYPYAIDIFWSCGSEQFNEPLRLHTFKRHSYSHKRIFNDQLITYRNKQLWFENYDTPRCIRINEEGELLLTNDSSYCSLFTFISARGQDQQHNEEFYITSSIDDGTTTTTQCLGLGNDDTVNCNSDRSTGGNECGGIDHRYLPLVMKMNDCDDLDSTKPLRFHFEIQAQDCSNNKNEYPNNDLCF